MLLREDPETFWSFERCFIEDEEEDKLEAWPVTRFASSDPATCVSCGKRFFMWADYQRHRRKYHPKKEDKA
jgi:hypothetical protein